MLQAVWDAAGLPLSSTDGQPTALLDHRQTRLASREGAPRLVAPTQGRGAAAPVSPVSLLSLLSPASLASLVIPGRRGPLPALAVGPSG